MLAIEIERLVKQYRNGVRALDNLSLKVTSGEIFTLLGPNGAGKSSLINILTTYYKPTSGNVILLGKNLGQEPAWVRTQIACVAQHISIDEHLSLSENMLFQSRLYKVDPQLANERIHALVESFALSKYLKYPVASYSGGIKRRLDIAMNMVSYPKILFLDEPTVGIDIESRKEMWKMLFKIRDEYRTTIFLTTHYLEEADQLSDTICIMKNGKQIAQGQPRSLRNYINQNMLRIAFSRVEKIKKYRNELDNLGYVKFTDIRGNSVFAGVDNSRTAFKEMNSWLMNRGIDIDALEIVEPSLEDVFLALMGSKEQNRSYNYV